jgi:hypothetical protein
MKNQALFIALAMSAMLAGTPGNAQPLRTFVKSTAATTRIQLPFGKFALWIDASQWKQTKTEEVGIAMFTNTNGQGWAKIITERISMPLDALRDVAVSNFREADQNTKGVLEEKRVVNGRQVLAIQMDATYKKIPVRFYGYCYAGTSGEIQVWTFTTQSLFAENADGFTRFLNGVEISDQEFAPPAPAPAIDSVLRFNADKTSLKYDPRRWKQKKQSEETGRFIFEHSSGNGYAVVTAERISIPMEALPDFMLALYQDTDPNARIVFQEKRKG